MSIRYFTPAIAALALVACTRGPIHAAEGAITPAHTIEFHEVDSAAAARVDTIVRHGVRRIEDFFGRPFRQDFIVSVYPDRESFNASFPPEWGMSETPCWVVATGVATELRLLSPRVWGEQACEHDPDDEDHLRGIITHELVHVYHGQYAVNGDFDNMESLAWFIEGLAVYLSGQLDQGHEERAIEAIRTGAAPDKLADAWSGPYRYGVAGSMVRYIDRRLNDETFRKLLGAPDTATALAIAGLSEEELIAGWRASLLDRSP